MFESSSSSLFPKGYSRKRDHPRFRGMRRRTDSSSRARQEPASDSIREEEDVTNSSLSRSLSDIWELEFKHSVLLPATTNHIGKNAQEDPDPVSENISRTSEAGGGGGSSHINGDPVKNSSSITDETKLLQRTHSSCERDHPSLSRISLPQSAASYYGGVLPGMDGSELGICEGIDRLNQYLKAAKADVHAGVPGRFLLAVMGPEVADLESVVSTIMYAFLLNETYDRSDLCTVPIINMKRAYLNMYTELKWLFSSCRVDQSSIIFIDEINLSYYELFGNLKLVLVNSHRLPSKQEGLKEAVVEIFNCKQDESQYPWVQKVTVGQGCSSCALVAEKFVEASPEILAGCGFSRLLLAGILLDTSNLTNAQCTSKDKYMATLLIKGAGRFGCNGLHQILKFKMSDTSDLKVKDILCKDFKKWTRVAGRPNITSSRLTVSHIGLSSIGISVKQLLAHEDSAAKEVTLFRQSEKLWLLMIVSGYYDSQKNFKREILISTNTVDLMKKFLQFFDTKGTHLPLKTLHLPDLGEELKAFEIERQMTSRRSIERLLEEFSGIPGKA